MFVRRPRVDVTLDDDDHMIHVYPIIFDIFEESRLTIDRIADL
jgi:hypothetical protein